MRALTARKIVYLALALPGALIWGFLAVGSIFVALPVATESLSMAILSAFSIVGLASLIGTFFIICFLPPLTAKDRRIAICLVASGMVVFAVTYVVGGGGWPTFIFSASALLLLAVAIAVIAELVYTPNKSFKADGVPPRP